MALFEIRFKGELYNNGHFVEASGYDEAAIKLCEYLKHSNSVESIFDKDGSLNKVKSNLTYDNIGEIRKITDLIIR